MPDAGRNVRYVLGFFFFLALFLPTVLLIRSHTLPLMVCYVVAFGCYLGVLKYSDTRFLFWLGVLTRLALFFSLPLLSDDVYRFLWDGHLMKNGIHPFAELPGFYLGEGIPGLTNDLFELLNSPNYFTVYPPINQGIFWLAAMGSENWLISAAIIRIFLLAADLGTFYYLRKLLGVRGSDQRLAHLYFLNPLIICEGVGNLHFEVMVIFFLTAALFYMNKNKTKSGAALGLAAGTKLLPFIFFPYFFLRELRYKQITLILTAVLVATTTLLPLVSAEFISGMQNSLALYFRNFEFNPSIFQIIKEISIIQTGSYQTKIIGPVLSVFSLISILTVSIIAVRKDWPKAKTMMIILTGYLLFSATVHPWYILPLIMLGLLSGQVYPIIWSLVIFATYMGYASADYYLHPVWLLIEYLAVFLAIIFNKKLKKWLMIS